ncbi:MAG: response regulator [ANME-2 cluster archaeon]|jgi:two-component system cell cycle response regulator DivK|nr:response regulator [ANME-2 cluster archaeon]
MTHILVVEDNPMNMELVVDLLESYGYEVTGSLESARALNLVKETKFDLILLDMQLPEMDGLELLKKFKDEPNTVKIPVVAVTAHVMKGDEERFIKAGCIGYISKPIDVHQFKSIVAGYLET